MTILITGGGSKIGSQLAQLLKADGKDVLFGSRSGRIPAGFEWVKLDWNDPSTFANPFSAPRQPGLESSQTRDDNAESVDEKELKEGRNIESVYLVAPVTDVHAAPKIIPFVELALSKGAKRFVYLSATIADRHNDSGGLGQLPGYFQDRNIDHFVLRPTWFIDNLLTDWGDEIRQYDRLTTALPTGRVPLVATEDIARVAYEAIVNEEIPFTRRDPLIIGPQLLSYDDVAAILTKVLGRKIAHVPVSLDEIGQFYRELYGAEHQEAADWLVDLDRGVEAGSEVGLDRGEGVVIGKVTLEGWVEKRKDKFAA